MKTIFLHGDLQEKISIKKKKRIFSEGKEIVGL
jgi:hypothetical protein